MLVHLERLRSVPDPSRSTICRMATHPSVVAGIGLCVALAIGVRSAFAQVDQSAYNRAETLIRNHQWDQGIEILQPLLKTAPANPRLLNLAGLAYTGKGDPKQADQYFESALRISP